MGCNGGSCSTGCSSCSNGENDGNDELPPGMLAKYNLNQSTASGALVWIEMDRADDPVPLEDSLKILKATSERNGLRTFAAIIGNQEIKKYYPVLFGCGAGTIYHIRGIDCEGFDLERYSSSLCEVIDRISPAIVTIASTEYGEMIGSRISSMLGVELNSKCDDFSIDDRILRTEPAPLGQFLISNRNIFPQIATIKADGFNESGGAEGEGTAIYWQMR